MRKSEHLAGKQHKGWEAIREHLNILKAMNDGKGPPRRKRDLDEMIGRTPLNPPPSTPAPQARPRRNDV